MWWPKIKFTYNLSIYKNKFRVSVLRYGFTLPHYFKILETCPSESRAKQLLEDMEQHKAPEKSQSVFCPKMLHNILTRILNCRVHRLFQRKLLLQTESCTVQSVKVYSQSSLIAILSKSTNVSCSVGHFLSSGMVLILHKDLDLKIPMVWSLWIMIHKDQEDHKLYWPVVTRC